MSGFEGLNKWFWGLNSGFALNEWFWGLIEWFGGLNEWFWGPMVLGLNEYFLWSEGVDLGSGSGVLMSDLGSE